MATIKTITKYVFKGIEYNSLKEVQDAVHNIIGEEVLDKINRKVSIRHQDLLILLEILCMPDVRKALMECYTANFEYIEDDDEFFNPITVNILDYKAK